MGGCTVSVDIEALEAYRRGMTTGVMKNATPNVVRELIGWIDELREVCRESSAVINTILDDEDTVISPGASRGDLDNVRLDLLLASEGK